MIAEVIKRKLDEKHRCLYFNSEPMVAELQSRLAQLGVDVAHEIAGTSLICSSDLGHLKYDQRFDIDAMIAMLAETLRQALHDGYAGLWSTGDVAWEFGPRRDFTELAEYERRLEDFLCSHPEISGICQYHGDVLPADAMRAGRETHPSFFISETESKLNPAFAASSRDHFKAIAESVFALNLPDDILERASVIAESQGLTLVEFINQAIAEKIHPGAEKTRKSSSNGR